MADTQIPREAVDAGARAIYERSIEGYSITVPGWDSLPDDVKLNFREAALAALNAAARSVVAAYLEGPFADRLQQRADVRDAIGDDDYAGDDDECDHEPHHCHTDAAVATWMSARTLAKAHAIELRGQA